MHPYWPLKGISITFLFLPIPHGVYSIVTSFYAFMLKNSRKGPYLASGHMVSPTEHLAYNTEVAIFPIASYEKPIASTDILSKYMLKTP